MDDVRCEVRDFSWNMESVLRLHDTENPNGWKDCDVYTLYSHLKEEMIELRNALFNGQGSPQEIQSECCDVANLAMMIWDKQRENI